MSAKTAQDAAEVYWAIATHADPRVAASWKPLYKTAHRELIKAIRDEYHMGPATALRVLQLVSEYGADDSLTGTDGARGVASYVAYVRRPQN